MNRVLILDVETSMNLDYHGGKIVVDDGDEHVLRLFLEGERDTAAYAEKLGIGHLSDEKQRIIVKQRRDRINQRLRRLKDDLT